MKDVWHMRSCLLGTGTALGWGGMFDKIEEAYTHLRGYTSPP